MKILICEDELIIAEFLKETCEELGYVVCGIAGTKADAVDKIVFYKPDLILLDINMGEQYSGIELAKYINQTIQVPFIFITAFSDVETVNQAIHTNPHAYLVKPTDKNTLQANIQLAQYRFRKPKESNEEYMTFVTDRGGHSVNIRGILYVEASGNYCEFVYEGGNRELLRISMQNVETHLKDKFIRIHKSYIINPDYIMGSTSLKVLIGPETISLPIGRAYKPKLYEYLGKI